MKKLILFVILATFSMQVKADLLLGLAAKSDTIAIAFKKNIRLISLKTEKTLSEFSPAADTTITGLIFRKALSSFQSDPNTTVSELKRAIEDFTIVNLTFNGTDLMVNFKFFKQYSSKSRLQYGVIKYNAQMQFQGFCFYRSASGIFNINPYFPSEFKGNTLLVPEMDSGRIQLSEYTLNYEQSIAMRSRIVQRKFYNYKEINIMANKNIVLSPMIYSFQNNRFSRYIIHPHPVMFYMNGELSNDPYNTRHKLSPQEGKNGPVYFKNGENILFDMEISREKKVVLATNSFNDSIFMVTTDNDSSRVDVIYESMKGVFTYRSFKIDTRSTYFCIHNYYLYAIRWKDGVATIERRKMYP